MSGIYVSNSNSKTRFLSVFNNRTSNAASPCRQVAEEIYICRRSGLTNVPNFPSSVLTIDLSYNQLAHLANDSFGDLPQLEILDLSHNAISRIDSEAFASFWDISVLDLSSNYLSDDSIHDKAFSKMGQMKTLYIQNNNFSHQYPEGAISSLKSLKRLNIDIFSKFEFGEGFSALQSLENITFYPMDNIHLRNRSFAGLTSQMLSRVYFDLGTGVVPPVDNGSFIGFPRIINMEFSFGGKVDVSKIEKVPRGIRGEKSSKDMASSRNLVSTIGALASPKIGDGTRCPEG